MDTVKKNKLKMLGTAATISSTLRFNSASRMQMATTMAGQAVVPKESDIPRILTGFEKQMSEFTFSVRAPEDLIIIALIDKYQKPIGDSVIKGSNPLTTVIYRSLETYKYGCFHIPLYQNQIDRVHETFSFRYKLTSVGKRLVTNMTLKRGELIAHSPNHKHGGYGTGLSTSVVYMATPYTIEDGFEVSRSFVERASPIATGIRRAEFGRRYYPLNMYANPNHPGKYMPFPNIGDRIRDDGVVFALRKNDPYLAGLEMTNRSLQQIDFKHDRIEYGEPGAVVVDVTVTCGSPNEGKNPNKPRSIHTPQGMDEVALIYENQIGVYYAKILDVYYQQKRENHNNISLTPEFQTLIEFAMGHKPNSAPRLWSDMEGRTVDQRMTDPITAYSSRTIQKTMKAKPIDEWFVEIVYAWEFKIGVGSKVSDLHGGKGVICAVREDDDMPKDSQGNRADMIIYEKSVIARMNLAQLYEHFINATSRDIAKDVKERVEGGRRASAWTHLLRYYELVAPETYEHAINLTENEIDAVLNSVVEHGIYLKISAVDSNLTLDICRKIMEYRPPHMSRLTYTPVGSTTPITTEHPMLIGEKYINVLEKADFKPSGVCGVLRQHHGCAAVENKNTKHSNPSKEQPPRLIGETEGRAGSAVMGGEVITDMMDYVNNPSAHKEVIRRLFTDNKPSAIYNLVDRSKIPRGRRPLLFVKHIGECAGWELTTERG